LPHDTYRALRREHPVHWHDEPGGPAHIARMQVRLAMQAVLQRFARIECGPIRYEGSSFVRSVVSMPATVWS